VLAFYEENETEPSLMIQAAKDDLYPILNKHLEAWMKYVGVMEENILRCVTNSKDKLEHPDLPYCGNPLAEMNVQGTDVNDLNNRVGGTYGCKRFINENRTQCEKWAKNITDFPHATGKNKVHDGLDLTAPTGTPVYAMFDGTVTNAGYSETLGNYVLIQSAKTEHNISTDANIIYTSYGHLSSFASNLTGNKIKQGTLIGYTGNSGSIAQNIEAWQFHLHLTIYSKNTNRYSRVNPIRYLTTKFNDNGNKIQ
jgi:murein DD-endopeptidase MepM/ murein hydrolase activator NlpD